MNKRILFSRIIGFLLMIIPFFISFYACYRLISIIIGIIIFSISLLISKKNNKSKVIFCSLFLLIMIYGIDYMLVYYLNRIPIFAYEFKSKENISTYESLFYRIYNCNNKKTLDNFYKLNYMCEDNLDIKDINSFLNNIQNNYKEYQNKFVTIKGNVSEIVGNDYITLHPYEQNNLVEGITFDKSLALKIENNNDNLEFYNKYEIYDNILVTGRVVEKDNNTIIIYDAKIEIVNNFDEFTLNIIESKNCKDNQKKLTTTPDYNYYTNCIDDIYVKYDEETIYGMIFTLETNKINLDKLIEKGKRSDNDIEELYELNNYNILKCKFSNNILIGNSKVKLNTKFCENFN